ncbi:LCP family protein [Micromonospora zhanjiangensis]
MGLRALTERYDRSVARQSLLDPAARRANGTASGPLNFLLVGSDQRPNASDSDARSDTIVIVHVPDGLRQAYLISVPRDLYVAIPPTATYPGGDDKINSAFEHGGGGQGGTRLLSATLSQLTGIRFDGAALIDFSGFEKVIDLVDGVRMCVDEPVRSIHTGTVFPVGCQQMDGARALDYARQRYGLPGGDFDRQRHQQQLLRAIMDRVAGADLLTSPLKFDRLIRAIGSAFTVDSNGAPIEDLVFGLRHLTAGSLVGVQLPSHAKDIDGISYVLLDPTADVLFRAVREAGMAHWVRDNPSWINRL